MSIFDHTGFLPLKARTEYSIDVRSFKFTFKLRAHDLKLTDDFPKNSFKHYKNGLGHHVTAGQYRGCQHLSGHAFYHSLQTKAGFNSHYEVTSYAMF